MNAAAGTRIRPIAAPEYEYELPTSEDADSSFTATVPVQPTPEPADWTELEVPYAEPEIPDELVEQELEELRASVAELAGRGPLGPDGRRARRRRWTKAKASATSELGSGRLVVERALRCLAGRTEGASSSSPTARPARRQSSQGTQGKILPPLGDDLARAAAGFDTLEELRADIERRLRSAREPSRSSARTPSTGSSGLERVPGRRALVEARAELLNALGCSSAGASRRRVFPSLGPDGRPARRAQRRALSVRASSCSGGRRNSASRSRTRRSRS